MEKQIFQLIALYFLYYIAIPVLILSVVWKIKQNIDFIKAFTIYNEIRKNKSSAILEKNNKKLKNLKILLVIFILISIPALNLTSYGVQDISMRRTRRYMGRGFFPGYFDRVEEKIGPTFDTEESIKQMGEEGSKEWYLDDIRDQINLDDLFRLPGRVTVYRLTSTFTYFEQIVITYNYLSPIPITRSIEFVVIDGRAFLETDDLIVYPMPPSMAAPV